MGKISNSTFRNARMSLDGAHYVNCTFDNCTFVFSGKAQPILEDCKLVDCGYAFEGAAGITVSFLASIKQTTPDIFDRLFEQILQSRAHQVSDTDFPDTINP